MHSITQLQEIINAELQKRSDDLRKMTPPNLYNPVDYSLEMGGKRLRPVLLLLSYNIFSDAVTEAIPAAVAIEVFHNFTLLHDDIMDKAEVRRNRPTVHIKFSENNAILSGDVMAFLSYKYLLECKSKRLSEVLELFTKTAIEVCEGQQFDMEFENRLNVSNVEYLEMIRLKTAVLIGCALKTGAIAGGANSSDANALYDFGINIGLAFQLKDDLLDVYGNEASFGKKIGGDILSNKKTYLLIHALNLAKGSVAEQLTCWLSASEFKSEEKIAAVTNIYNSLGVQKICEDKMLCFYEKAIASLEKVSIEVNKKHELRKLAEKLMSRND